MCTPHSHSCAGCFHLPSNPFFLPLGNKTWLSACESLPVLDIYRNAAPRSICSFVPGSIHLAQYFQLHMCCISIVFLCMPHFTCPFLMIGLFWLLGLCTVNLCGYIFSFLLSVREGVGLVINPLYFFPIHRVLVFPRPPEQFCVYFSLLGDVKAHLIVGCL